MTARKQQSFDKLPSTPLGTGKTPSYIIGIDEVGRGPLAGPVVVCAVAIPRNRKPSSLAKDLPLRPSTSSGLRPSTSSLRHSSGQAGLRPSTSSLRHSSGQAGLRTQKNLVLRDSKKLTARQRAAWSTAIKNDDRIFYSIASASPRVIDRINIARATNRAATRALENLLDTLPSPSHVNVFLDGGLYIVRNSNFEFLISKNTTRQKYQSRFHGSKTKTPIDLKIETVIKGDEKIPTISLASIVAKEHRDALMRRAHKKYPDYEFDRNVGYGTRQHVAAIKQHGRIPLHRNSFLKKI